MDLKGRVWRRERREHPPATGSFLRWSQQLGLDQADVRSLAVPAGFPLTCRGPSSCGILHCLPRHIRRELDQKWRSGGLKSALLRVTGLRGGYFTCCATMLAHKTAA